MRGLLRVGSATLSGKRKSIFLVVGLVIICGIIAFGYYRSTRDTARPKVQANAVTKSYEKQLPALKAKAEQHPDDATARKAYAVALYVTGNKQEAQKQYEAAVKLDPQDATTYNNLGNTYRDLGKTNEATEAYEKAIHINAKLINPYVNLANLQMYTLHKADDGIATYKAALKAMPANAEVQVLLGLAYEQMGNVTEAKQTFQSVLASHPDNAAAKSNLDRLK